MVIPALEGDTRSLKFCLDVLDALFKKLELDHSFNDDEAKRRDEKRIESLASFAKPSVPLQQYIFFTVNLIILTAQYPLHSRQL